MLKVTHLGVVTYLSLLIDHNDIVQGKHFSKLSRNLEANASECPVNLEEILLLVLDRS